MHAGNSIGKLTPPRADEELRLCEVCKASCAARAIRAIISRLFVIHRRRTSILIDGDSGQRARRDNAGAGVIFRQVPRGWFVF